MEFDVELVHDPSDLDFSYVRFQNNIQSIFNRVRLLYGATPIEDIPYYNVIIRQLTEWTGSTDAMDQTSINEGIGGVKTGSLNNFSGTAVTVIPTPALVNVRQKYIHGIDMTNVGTVSSTGAGGTTTGGSGKVPNAKGSTTLLPLGPGQTGLTHEIVTTGNPIRRYQVQLMLGLFQQEKLIPTKFMASQLAIEITLENPSACMYYQPSVTWTTQPAGLSTTGTPTSVLPTYQVTNVNLIPEILEFDASYDETFLRGLQTGGVPIKFATWNNYRFSQNGVSSVNLQIQERSRSVKAIFCMLRREPASHLYDSGAAFFNTDDTTVDGASTFQEYQFRIGGRYNFILS